jgi:hypothetical protein
MTIFPASAECEKLIFLIIYSPHVIVLAPIGYLNTNREETPGFFLEVLNYLNIALLFD